MCGPGTSLPGEGCALLRGNGSSQISLCLLSLWRKEVIFLSSFIYFLGIRQIFLILLASRCLQVFPMVLLWKGQIPWHNRLCSQGLPNPFSLDPCCCLWSPQGVVTAFLHLPTLCPSPSPPPITPSCLEAQRGSSRSSHTLAVESLGGGTGTQESSSWLLTCKTTLPPVT